ncbi:MAG: hypothetical protein ACYCO0_01550 [Candidatus Micrarchaeaceae archaeon]
MGYKMSLFSLAMFLVIITSITGIASAQTPSTTVSPFCSHVGCPSTFYPANGQTQAPSTVQQPIIKCTSMFSSSSPYDPALAKATSFGSIVSISLLIILTMMLVVGLVYAFGYAFHIEAFLNFAKTEMLESMVNVAIITVIGVSLAWVGGAINFFANFASLQGSPILTSSSASAMYVALCSNIQTNVIGPSFSNWFGVFMNLYVTNLVASNAPPGPGGLTLYFIPNSFGISFTPLQGVSVMTALLWDEQTTYFGSIFMGVSIIMLLFIIYFLFPLFLYIGLALRSFPWTRPAGGSLIAMFIAFYIIFPALIYPFTVSNPASDPNAGRGFCNSGTTFSKFSSLCNAPNFVSGSWSAFLSLFNFDLGDLFYANVYAFVQGLETVGINLTGLIIGLLISYELVEKIGGLLGSPSLQGSRALSRVL